MKQFALLGEWVFAQSVPTSGRTVSWWGSPLGFGCEAVIVLVVIAVPIWVAFRMLIAKAEPTRYSVADKVVFDTILAILAGGALTVLASAEWATALLVAGACLGIGFLFGLLFGYPSSGPLNPTGGTGGTGPNLLRQSVDAIGKLIAGATLVKSKDLYELFLNVSKEVSRCARVEWICSNNATGDCGNNYAYGAALTLYFLVVGFLAGILLPHFYPLIPGVRGSHPREEPQDTA